MAENGQRTSRLKAVIQVSSGNFLEMYDFTVFAYYAAAIGATFFPSGSESASLLKSFATFAVGFLMRPLGAIILGAYIDRHGRRAGLILSLALMSVGTASIALLPGYMTLGIVSPLLVLAGRLLQGFSAGVELGGVSVYLSEIATPGNKGFYVSWQSGSQQVAVIFASLLGAGLALSLTPEQMASWGWRIPLLVGCLIIPFLFVLRASLPETDEFLAQSHHPSAGEIFRSVAANWQLVFLGMLLVSMTTGSFYLITAYTPTFGHTVLHLPLFGSLVVTVCVGLSNLFWLPLGGALSDRIGRKPVLIATTTLAIFTAYPVMLWLVSAPSFPRLLMVELWLSFIYGVYNGAMVVFLTEIMPVSVRTSGFSIAYSLATAIFGGSTPFIVTWLIGATGNQAVAGIWVSVVAVLGLVATLLLKPQAVSLPVRAAAASA